ncbi:MAG TPA: HEAT repeat domain-containing protein [Roseiflexaceae bacterium]|nr:HEAT repeat domain-containing protein [Roseiflexaceae bacterium]
MFNQDTWRRRIAERLSGFARHPRQEMQIAGAPSLLSFLATHAVDPFLEAFQNEPVAAVLTLAEIARGPGADQLVRRATRARYQHAAQLDRELRASRELRAACEHLLVELQVVSIARQRLNGAREEWLRATLDRDLDAFPGEFAQLRRVLSDPGGHARAEALRHLRARNGHYTPADLVLLHDGLHDASAQVRASAARLLGMFADHPPQLLTRALVQVALHDCDAETRFAAARALGMLRHSVASPQLLDQLSDRLTDDDTFVRSAAALVLGQLGDLAATQRAIHRLTGLLEDRDAYTREAAARALGSLGAAAAIPEVLAALARAAQDGDIQVHEAATDSLATLREIQPNTPLELAASV